MLPPPWPLETPFNINEWLAWDTPKPAGSPCEIRKAQLKELGPIGHKVDRFLSARGRCWKMAAKAAPDSVLAWVRSLSATPPGEISAEGLFACGLTLGDRHIRLQPLMFPHEVTSRLGQLWQQTDPEAPKSLPPAAEVPRDADAPLWLALLRLGPLREFWNRELRRATVDSLLNLLADAWVLNPERVPEGAVIPRLELASWSDLPHCRETKRSFAVAPAHSREQARVLDEAASEESWSSFTREALDAFHEEPRVLVEFSGNTSTPAPLIVAFYEKKAGRVDMLGAMALIRDGTGRLAPARLVAVEDDLERMQ
jgi:hypothetical protein